MPKTPALHARDASGLSATLCGARLKQGAVAVAQTQAEVTCKRCLQWKYTLRATPPEPEPTEEPAEELTYDNKTQKELTREFEDHIAASWELFRRYRAEQEGRDPDVRVKKDDTIMDDWRAHELWRREQDLPLTFSGWSARRYDMQDIYAYKAELERKLKSPDRTERASAEATRLQRAWEAFQRDAWRMYCAECSPADQDPEIMQCYADEFVAWQRDKGLPDLVARDAAKRARKLPPTLEEALGAAPLVVLPKPAQKAPTQAPVAVQKPPRPLNPKEDARAADGLPERVWAYRAFRVVAPQDPEGFTSRWLADRRDAEWLLELLARPAEQHHEEVELLDGSRWHHVIYWEPEEGDQAADELRIEEALIEQTPDSDLVASFELYAERIAESRAC